MTGPYASQAPQALHAADRPDFEQVLHQALNTPEIRTALRNGSAEGPDLDELRSQALADAASIAVAAETEYGAYVRQRALAPPGATAGAPAASGNGPGQAGREQARQEQARQERAKQERAGRGRAGQGLLPALAVLTPVLATAATVVFFLLGHALGLGGSQRRLADTLLTAAGTTAVLAALTTAAGAVWLFTTAVRHRAAPPERQHERVAAARRTWQRALLERGVLPYLRERLHQNGTARTAEPARRPRLGYSSPDFAAPDYASPDYASPDFSVRRSSGEG